MKEHGMPEQAKSQTFAFHVSLNTANLAKSVEFYSTFFGQPPAKHFDDYAKFEVADPAVVLSLEPAAAAPVTGGALNHFGIRVKDAAQIRSFYERLAASGIEMQWLSG